MDPGVVMTQIILCVTSSCLQTCFILPGLGKADPMMGKQGFAMALLMATSCFTTQKVGGVSSFERSSLWWQERLCKIPRPEFVIR